MKLETAKDDMNITLSLKPETIEALKRHAYESRQSMSGVVEAALSQLLARQPEASNAVPKLGRREAQINEAYDRLLERFADDKKQKGETRFTLKEFAHEAGLYPSEALQGLRGLERLDLLFEDTKPDPRFYEEDIHPEIIPEIAAWTRLPPETVALVKARRLRKRS